MKQHLVDEMQRVGILVSVDVASEIKARGNSTIISEHSLINRLSDPLILVSCLIILRVRKFLPLRSLFEKILEIFLHNCY